MREPPSQKTSLAANPSLIAKAPDEKRIQPQGEARAAGPMAICHASLSRIKRFGGGDEATRNGAKKNTRRSRWAIAAHLE
jgi:hypothetical protein